MIRALPAIIHDPFIFIEKNQAVPSNNRDLGKKSRRRRHANEL
jgi:hypothetical protein